MWIVPDKGNSSEPYMIDMVLMDEEGTRIQATIENTHVSTFKGKIKEHGLYGMMRFEVRANNGDYRPTSHPFRLYFKESTKIKERDLSSETEFPKDLYTLKSFTEIKNTHRRAGDDLFDTIGKFKFDNIKYSLQPDGLPRAAEFILEDLDKNQLSCTLWGEYAQALRNMPSTSAEPHIMLLQLCRAKTDYGEVILANSFYYTKVIVDESIPEIEDFHTKLVASSQSSSSANSTGFFIDPALVKSMSELLAISKRSRCWIFGKITNILNRRAWSYQGCVKESCSKKASAHGDKFKCSKCNEVFDQGIHRYKITVIVKDSSGSVTLCLWDHECRQLLHKTAGQLREQLNLSGIHETATSKEIDDLVGLHLLFRVDISEEDFKKSDKVFSVRCLTQNDDLMNQFLAKTNDEQQVDLESDDDLEIFFSQPGVTSSNNIDDATTTTPMSKRSLLDYEEGHDGGSSTQNSTSKLQKTIKVEKP
ncbi:unnamed protein product [Cuscuta europaea]|nr:unnamed protein product [Cuscuta europaea]